MTMIAHETTHLLFERTTGAFDNKEHTKDPSLPQGPDADDLTCLMYQNTTTLNRLTASARFFPVVQQELRVRTNQGTNGW
jgi:hypothetical protein